MHRTREVLSSSYYALSGVQCQGRWFCSTILMMLRLEIKLHLLKAGIHPHPGPVSLDIANPSSLDSKLDVLLRRNADYMAITEHSIPSTQQGSFHSRLNGTGCKAILSGLDPELAHHTGGVGLLHKGAFAAMPIQPFSPSCRSLMDSGRLGLFLIDIGRHLPLLIYIVYGWTGARTNARAAQRTNDIFKAILDEIQFQSNFLFAVVGDFNAGAPELTYLQELLDQHCVDIGASQTFVGEHGAQPTCYAPNAAAGKGTRNDHFLSCFALLPYIQSFEIFWDREILVHAILRVTFTGAERLPKRTLNWQPPSLYGTLRERFCILHPQHLPSFDTAQAHVDWRIFLVPF